MEVEEEEMEMNAYSNSGGSYSDLGATPHWSSDSLSIWRSAAQGSRRRYLREQRVLPRQTMSLCPFWLAGRASETAGGK